MFFIHSVHTYDIYKGFILHLVIQPLIINNNINKFEWKTKYRKNGKSERWSVLKRMNSKTGGKTLKQRPKFLTNW